MSEKEDTDAINFKTLRESKRKFMKKCNDNNVHVSKLLRSIIDAYTEDRLTILPKGKTK